MADKNSYIQTLFSVDKPEMKRRLFSMIDFMEYACTGNEEVYPWGEDKKDTDKYGDIICLTYKDGKVQDVYRFEDYDARRWYLLKNDKRIAVSDLVDEFSAIAELVIRDENRQNPEHAEEDQGNIARFLDFVSSN